MKQQAKPGGAPGVRNRAILLLGLCWTACVPIAQAQRTQEDRLPDTRAQHARLRRIKACVALIPTLSEPQAAGGPNNPFAGALPDPDAAVTSRSPNPYPYLFYVLNERTDMRPDGWRYYNPAASTFPSLQQRLRWPTLLPTQQLGPDMAVYWEVLLNEANAATLAQMDVIYIPIARFANNAPVPTFFTEEQRQLLARLVDSGVTVWVDWAVDAPTVNGALGGNENPAGAPQDRNKNAFFTNLDFGTYSGTAANPTAGHPLTAGRFVMQPGESIQIGSLYGAVTTPSQNRAVETRALDMQPTTNFTAVVGLTTAASQTGAYVAAARYGAGFVVATAGNVGKALAGMIPAGTVQATLMSPRPDLAQAQLEDIKFAHNLVAWREEVTGGQKNSRRTGQSNVEINGMIEQGSVPYLLPNGNNPWPLYPPVGTPVSALPSNPCPPLVINGMVVGATRYLSGGSIVSELNAFEVRPEDDFDGNGYADDPITFGTAAGNTMADLSLGQPYDRVMSVPLGTAPLYGLATGEVPEPGAAAGAQGAKMLIFAAGPGGLLAVPAPRPGLPLGDYWNSGLWPKVAPNTLGVQYTGAPAVVNVPAPASNPPLVATQVYGGGIRPNPLASPLAGKVVGFTVDATGTAVPNWYYPPNLPQESGRLGPVAGPLVTAQLQDTGTGAVDTMVFVTTAADPNMRQGGVVAGDTNGKVEGFIVATKGELLGFPSGGNQPAANTQDFGRRFTAVRWLNVPPGTGAVPPGPELAWDPARHWEVRVLDKATGYVVARFLPSQPNAALRPQLLPDGTGGQVLLPRPDHPNLPRDANNNPLFQEPGQPGVWDLNRFNLVADYSWLPIPTDNNQGRTLRPRFSPGTPYERAAVAGQSPVQVTGIGGGVSVGKDNLVYYGTGNGYMCCVEWRRGRPLFRWKLRALEYQDNTGTITGAADVDPASPTYLQDFAFTSAPAAGDRVIFTARGRGGNPGTVYVLEPNAVIQVKLNPRNLVSGVPFSLTPTMAQDVVIEGDHGVGIQQTPQGRSGIKAIRPPFGRVPGQFTVDPDTATVTFQNMENISLTLSPTEIRSPEELLALGIDTGGKPACRIRWWIQPTGYALPMGTPNVAGRAEAWVPLPLVALYRSTSVPTGGEQFRSGAVVAGGRILLMGASGYMHELPLDPRGVDSRFPRRRDDAGSVVTGLNGFDLGNASLYRPNGLRRTRNVSFDASGANRRDTNPPPAVADGIVVVSTPRGLTSYISPSIVVADSNRIIEASGDSTALAITDVTVKHRLDRSEFPIPTDPSLANTGGFPILTERKQLSRPSVIRKLNRGSSLASVFANSSVTFGSPDLDPDRTPAPLGNREQVKWATETYLAADTGNNRVVEFTPAGKAIWECAGVSDPFGLLPAGETLKLSSPMDVQRWVEVEQVSPGVNVSVIHTLIADTGNTRILEVVDKVRYQGGVFNAGSYVTIPGQIGADGADIRWYHALVWCSQTNAQGLRLRYRTAQRLFWPDATGRFFGYGPGFSRTAVNGFPYLPAETALTYTMATVSGQQVYWPRSNPAATPVGLNFHQFHNPSARDTAINERRPSVRPGGDSIVFLRGRLRIDEASPTTPVPVAGPRENRPGFGGTGDAVIFSQGVVDPNVPIITAIGDEAALNPANPSVHALNGVQSVQRTIRQDVRFGADLLSSSSPIIQGSAMYFLIADSDGIWECRMTPIRTGVMQPLPNPQFRLSWAFSNEDYAYCTGAGNGNPLLYASGTPANQTPGGRLLSATSARRLPNGYVLVASRTPENLLPNPGSPGRLAHAGADVFLLRPADYFTATERAAIGANPAYDRVNIVDASGRILHGWRPDLWVQTLFSAAVPAALKGNPSIRWRAAEQLNPAAAPTLRTPFVGGVNPLELTGSYVPVQPNYADVVF